MVVLLAVPALGMKTHSANLETLPTSIPEVQTMRDLSAAYPSEGTTAEVVVARGRAAATSSRRPWPSWSGRRGDGQFRSTGEPVAVSADGRTSVLTIGIPYDESDDRVDSAIRELRADLAPQALDGLGVEHAVGGDAAESLDFVDRQQERLPLVIGFVLLLTLLIMAATFRSLPIAIISAVLNLASVGVAFGMMALVFQHGWFESALDFTSPGFVIDWIPLFVLVVLVGLSMDYHVFVLSRVREHVQRGLPTRLAVRQGVAETAGVVTSAAAVMVSVFSIFATLSMLEMKMMGVGLSFAILLDATLIRLVMLPAILCLLGDRAWWPSRRPQPRGEQVVEREPAYELAAAAEQTGLDTDGYAVQRGVPADVQTLRVGQVVDGDPGDVRGVREAGAPDLVAVAVRERDHAGHHVVHAADLDVDAADPGGHPDHRARLDPPGGQVVGVHQQVVARLTLGQPARVVQPGVAVPLVLVDPGAAALRPPAVAVASAASADPLQVGHHECRCPGRSGGRWSGAARASSGAAGRGRRPRGSCAAPSSWSARRS